MSSRTHDILDIWNLLSEPLAKWEKYDALSFQTHFRLFHPHLVSSSITCRRNGGESKWWWWERTNEITRIFIILSPLLQAPTKYTIINYLSSGWMFLIFFSTQVYGYERRKKRNASKFSRLEFTFFCFFPCESCAEWPEKIVSSRQYRAAAPHSPLNNFNFTHLIVFATLD